MRVLELQKEIKDTDILQRLDIIEDMIITLRKEMKYRYGLAEYDYNYVNIITDKIITVLRKIFFILDIGE